MNAEQKLERKRAFQRARTARFLNNGNNRVLDLARRQRARDNVRLQAQQHAPPPPVVVIEPEPIPSADNMFNLRNTTKFLETNTLNKHTLNKQLGALRSMFRVTEIDNIGSTLTTFNTIKRMVESSLQINGEPYSVATKSGFIYVVIHLITKMEIPMTKTVFKKYTDYYTELKIQEQDKARARKTDPAFAVLPYTTYMERIEKQFGKNSKQFLVASLYNEVVARDNFGSISIIPNINGVVDDKANYLFVPSNIETPMKIILQTFKNVAFIGGVTYKLSMELSNLLRYYILNHKLTDKLFPEIKKGMLSQFINSMNKKIGVNGGINYIRHSKVSEFLATNPTAEQRRIFSEKSQQSTDTQYDYTRMLVDGDDDDEEIVYNPSTMEENLKIDKKSISCPPI